MTKLAQIDFENIKPPQGPGTKLKIDSSLTIGGVITNLLPYLFAFAGVALLIYLLMGGFKMMTSAGDAKKIQEGQHIITNALIGFVIVFIAFWLVQLVASILGLDTIGKIFQ